MHECEIVFKRGEALPLAQTSHLVTAGCCCSNRGAGRSRRQATYGHVGGRRGYAVVTQKLVYHVQGGVGPVPCI